MRFASEICASAAGRRSAVHRCLSHLGTRSCGRRSGSRRLNRRVRLPMQGRPFSIPIGWHEARIPTIAQAVMRGGFAWATRRLKEAVRVSWWSLPIASTLQVGRSDPWEVGDADMVSLARAMLADADFATEQKAGDRPWQTSASPATRPAWITTSPGSRRAVVANPRAGRETAFGFQPSTEAETHRRSRRRPRGPVVCRARGRARDTKSRCSRKPPARRAVQPRQGNPRQARLRRVDRLLRRAFEARWGSSHGG